MSIDTTCCRTHEKTLERASAYLSRVDVAVSGQGGDYATFGAAQALVRGFSLSVEEALPLLVEWNKDCKPPWSEADLRAKLRSASTSSGKEEGYLLKEEGPAFARNRRGTAAAFQNEAERRAWQRRKWPELRRLSREELYPIARLRRMPWNGLHIAQFFRLLKGCRLEGADCFVVCEGRFAQARRCDGLPFTNAEGKAIKAKNLPGSEGSFVGRCLLSQVPNVLLVEGAVGLLEALTAYALVDMKDSWTVLAATSASSRLTSDPALLKALAGRRVRIVPDMDEAGQKAAAFWVRDLREVGARVETMDLPAGCKDIGSLLVSPEESQDELDQIFR